MNEAQFLFQPTPRIAGDLLGLPLCFSPSPETFSVTEIPAYLPSGSGSHIYLDIEKQDLSSDELLQVLSKSTTCPHRDIGTAGRKDKKAKTRQWVSLPEKYQANLATLQHPQLVIHQVSRHNNKLGLGHLLGNQFVIHLPWQDPKQTWDDDLRERAHAIAARIRPGLLNSYGPQRFGSKGDTGLIGYYILTEQWDKVVKKWQTRHHADLALSALQSLLFNAYTAQRFSDNTHRTFVSGDVAIKITGAQFLVEQPTTEQPRLDAGEIAVAGPMFGKKMREASGASLAYETKVLSDFELSANQFNALGNKLPGTRRALTQQVSDLTLHEKPHGLTLNFSLPSGSYATTLVQEFLLC